jgi:hypothetical protein
MEPAKFKPFSRTHIAREDFEGAAKFIDAARRYTIATIEYEALLHAAIIAYARPFSGNERGSDPPSDAKIDPALVALLGADLALHERILHVRNKMIAHAEVAANPVAIVAVKSNFDVSAGFVTQSRRWHILDEQIDLDVFHRIAKAMSQQCINRQFDIALDHLGFRA